MMVIVMFTKTYLRCDEQCLTILPLWIIVQHWIVEGSNPAYASNLEAEENLLKSPNSPIICAADIVEIPGIEVILVWYSFIIDSIWDSKFDISLSIVS